MEDNQNLHDSVHSFIKIYTFLLDKLGEGIHAVDVSGLTVVYNRKMEEIEGMNREDVLNKNVLDVFQFQSNGQSTLLATLATGKETKNVKQTYFNNRGEQITTVNHTYPIYDGHTLVGAAEIVQDVSKMQRMIQENILKRHDVKYKFSDIIGNSQSILNVIDEAKRATRTNSSILIVGETGTGKELIAQSIHTGSARAVGPFVSQNCAALPEALIEGLLFGTARGAFTGAVDRPGLLEMAQGGTLLLDELNSLAPNLQAKLLRAIQEKVIRRVGDTKDIPVDVRIIATMNEDPTDAIAANRLREDLYYRLSVVSIQLPPLRSRTPDISLLVDSFIEKYNRLFQMDIQGIDPNLLSLFKTYTWPGNVRELEHAIEGAMNIIGDEPFIQFQNLPFHLRRKLSITDVTTNSLIPDASINSVSEFHTFSERSEHTSQTPAFGINHNGIYGDQGASAHRVTLSSTNPIPSTSLKEKNQGGGENSDHDFSQSHPNKLNTQLAALERTLVEQTLAKHDGSVSSAAREMGISRQSLQYRLRKWGINRK